MLSTLYNKYMGSGGSSRTGSTYTGSPSYYTGTTGTWETNKFEKETGIDIKEAIGYMPTSDAFFKKCNDILMALKSTRLDKSQLKVLELKCEQSYSKHDIFRLIIKDPYGRFVIESHYVNNEVMYGKARIFYADSNDVIYTNMICPPCISSSVHTPTAIELPYDDIIEKYLNFD